MRFLFGEFTAVRGTPDGEFALPGDSTNKNAVGDFGASGSLRFANGASGTINARAKDYFIFEFEILGSQASEPFFITSQYLPSNSSGLAVYFK